MGLSFHGFMGFENTSAKVGHAGKRSEAAMVQHYAKGSVSMFALWRRKKLRLRNSVLKGEGEFRCDRATV